MLAQELIRQVFDGVNERTHGRVKRKRIKTGIRDDNRHGSEEIDCTLNCCFVHRRKWNISNST